jgi:ribosomal peptide maturation radical SAM protein 1
METRAVKNTDVLLISMPFGPLLWPSIGLSLLKAGLAPLGVKTYIRYFTLDFARRIGQTCYDFIANDTRLSLVDLPGEWLFSSALFDTPDEQAFLYLDEIGRWQPSWPDGTCAKPLSATAIAKLIKARRHVDGFLETCLAEIERACPRIVGFTSMFQQHVASLALARHIKRRWPRMFVVLGGPNCEGISGVETARQFPFLDATVSGEGDIVFPELVRRVMEGRHVDDLPGVWTRQNVVSKEPGVKSLESVTVPGAPMVRRLDDLPVPDYEDFFEQFKSTPLNRAWRPTLLFETSRGCWWGERQHCTFCGANGQTMAYRSKSPERALSELIHITRRHPGLKVQVVDNILDMGYFQTFLPELARRKLDVDLFYETKSNLKKEQLRVLRDAGARRVQPGIESLSDQVLRLMRKGVSGLQNIQLLKWSKELGVIPVWNFLWGFPGEDPLEYASMARLVPHLVHLPPPERAIGILLDRFSPNFMEAERLGFAQVAPYSSLKHIYPLPPDALHNLAYHFSFRYQDDRDVAAYVGPLVKATGFWKRHHNSSDLFSVTVEPYVIIWDLRPGARTRLIALEGLDRALFEACETITDIRRLVDIAAKASPGDETGTDVDALEKRLRPLTNQGILIQHRNRFLSVVLPLGEYSPRGKALERFYRVASACGQRTNGEIVVPLGPAVREVRVRTRRLKITVGRSRRIKQLSPEQFSIADDCDLRMATPSRSPRANDVVPI